MNLRATGAACDRGGWADKKARIERMCISLLMSNVYLSPYVKGNKKFRTCFSNFEIPMFYLYGHSMNVSDIAISWLW